ncbi:MAG: hypothetical protein HY586_05270 [Candidatus Omnitrophica bacterium]|nr:hypothetical protein [Candidatus Omnitrophota bacterium]
MFKKLVIGGVLGGIIVFAWGAISWMVLPFHVAQMKQFTDEAAVQTTVMLNVDAQIAGIYTFPSCPKHKTASPQAQQELGKQACAQMEHGPMGYIVVNPKGIGSLVLLFVKAFLMQLAGALLAVWLLLQAKLKTYSGRYLFLVVFSVAVAILGYLPAWNWSGYPCLATLLHMADVVIGYILAGLVLAKVTE